MVGSIASASGRWRRQLSVVLAALLVASLAWISLPVRAASDPGTIWTWGANGFGQLGDGTTSAHLSPAQVPGLTGIIDVHGGREHIVALNESGTVYTWGSNQHGQIGMGTVGGTRPTPFQVPGIADAIAVTTGHYHSMALRSDGSVWAWGYNAFGQLGDGTTTRRTSPVRVSGAHVFVAIAAGRDMSYAIRADGTLWGWGLNTEGQLGDGTTTNRTTPVRVGTLANVVDVAGGRDHGLAVLANGTMWAWGWNQYGQLGDGTTTNRTAPVQIGTGYRQVIAGAHHSFGLRTDGSVWSWGRNYRSALGDGTTASRTQPVRVLGVDDAVKIGTGRDHGMAVLADGTVRAWGYNAFGQIGDGTTTARPQSVVVPGLTHATIVSAGAEYSLALATDGTPPTTTTTTSSTTTSSTTTSSTTTSTTTTTIPPQNQPAVFRAAVATNVNSSSPRVTIPASVAAGDVLVMIATLNSNSPTVSDPPGWTRLDFRSDAVATVQTYAWSKKATAADAGSLVGPAFSVNAKVALQVAAYSSAESVSAFAVNVNTVSTTTRTTPVVPVAQAGSMLVSYWADKSADGNGWVLPQSVNLRSQSVGQPNGLISAALADSGPMASGNAGGIQATSTASPNRRGVTWSIVVSPAAGGPGPNQAPVAVIANPVCVELTCTFSGEGSTDPDGSIASYSWDFGDGATSDGASTSHTFSSAGTYTVRLTVTDDFGATGTVTRGVTVTVSSPGGPGRVIVISVDGLAANQLGAIPAAEVPGWSRIVAEGAATLNARTTFEETRTLPNHASMFTGRHVATPGGHGVTFNEDNGSTIHVSAGNYVSSMFDIVHDAGHSTSLFVGKPKFNFFNRSWNGTNGAPDVTGPDNGRDKIDTYQSGTDTNILTAALNQLLSDPATLTVIHFSGPDDAGHSFGWGTPQYLQAVRDADARVAQVLNTVAGTPALSDAVVIMTTDHGGSGTNHASATVPAHFTIPFGVWGSGVSGGVDLYSINPNRASPGTGRPTYAVNPQPIRNAEVANLVTTLLGLPIVPGSTINASGDLLVTGTPVDLPPGVSITAPAAGSTVTGVVTITASASDDGVVESVQFTLNGEPLATDTDGSDGWSTEWDTATVSSGQHLLGAVAVDDAGQTGGSSQVAVTVPGNQAPEAVIAPPSCSALECVFDGSASSDSDGSITSYAWDFGDGTSSSEMAPTYSYSQAGTYLVSLVVIDNQGAVGSAERAVTVSDGPPASSVAFRAAATSNANTAVPTVSVPSSVQAGDVLVLFLTGARDASITVPTGWTLLGTRLDGTDLRTWALTRLAPQGMGGTTLQVTLDERTKADMTLLAYSGAAGVAAAVSANETGTSASHASPAAPVAQGGSWVVSYWADKSNNNTSWTLPGQVTGRTSTATEGSGRIVAVSGDSGPVAAGTWNGLTATSGVSSAKAIAWTIVIAPS